MAEEYRGVPIELTREMKFRILLPGAGEQDEGTERVFPSYQEAKAAIDENLAIRAKARKLRLPVYVATRSGEISAEVVTGVNRHSRDVTGLKTTRQIEYLLPDLDVLVDLFQRWTEAQRLTEALSRLLSRYSVNKHRSHVAGERGSGDIAAEVYGDYLDRLEADYQGKRAAALEIDIDAELAEEMERRK